MQTFEAPPLRMQSRWLNYSVRVMIITRRTEQCQVVEGGDLHLPLLRRDFRRVHHLHAKQGVSHQPDHSEKGQPNPD